MRRRSEGNDPRSRALSFHARSCDAESFLSVARSPSTSAAFFLALHRLICASRQLRGLLRATRLPAFSPGRRPRANAVRRVAPQEQPHSNHSRSSHPPTAFRATGLACSGGILAAGAAKTASMNPPESRRTDVPDAWFDHAAGVIMVRKACRLPVPDRRRGP